MVITWDGTFEGQPVNSDILGEGNEAIQDLKEAIRERFSAEHVLSLVSDQRHGTHLKGSAMVYVGSSEPTTLPDGLSPLTTSDVGRLWFKSTDRTLYTWSGTIWQTVSPNDAAPTQHASSTNAFGAASTTEFGHAMGTDALPLINGVANAGTKTDKYANPNHVHPLQIIPSPPTGTDALPLINGIASAGTKTDKYANPNHVHPLQIIPPASGVPANQVTLTAPLGPSTWTVPAGVTRVKVTVIGGGGGSSGQWGYDYGGGGGCGQVRTMIITVTSGSGVPIGIGAPGANGPDGIHELDVTGSSGNNSYFASLIALGGEGGLYNDGGWPGGGPSNGVRTGAGGYNGTFFGNGAGYNGNAGGGAIIIEY